jgi:glutaminyl-tRNA synthetase
VDDVAPTSKSNFIKAIIDEDLATGKHQQVVTRFPPEPNGYLHIGHAKSICLNFGLAKDYGGTCHLRFDDTNPTKEEQEYVDSIQHDIRWLGFEWGDKLFFASDYFDLLHAMAVHLIEDGKAYVDSLSVEEIREHRGSLTEPGRPSPYRDRSVADNLDLFARMRAGEFANGAHVLRAKIDMSAANMLMRDPPLYRILHATHHRTGDAWCIYPLYDFTHCLSDAQEGITHSICTLEFENNRELYDWVLDNTPAPRHPQQIEFARLSLAHTIMSKRNLLQLVTDGHVSGWDDPRMPTLAGMRRRGITPEAIRAFADMIGVAKANSMVDMAKLEFCVRDDLNAKSPRAMAVLRPLKVVVTNYPEGQVEWLDAAYWPHDIPKEGSRKVPFTRELYIERDDFLAAPPKGWHRLAPGREVRLRYAYYLTCEAAVTDPATGEVVELRCTYDPASRGGGSPDGRKVRGTLHWVSAPHSVACEVRLIDRLFTAERPGADRPFLEDLNPDSLEVLSEARLEPSLAAAEAGSWWQFERQGYFFADPLDSAPGAPKFNRVVELRDSWAKIAAKHAAPEAPAPAAPAALADPGPPGPDGDERARPTRRSPAEQRARLRQEEPALAARLAHYTDTLGLPWPQADLLTGDAALADFFEAALAVHPAPASLATWIVNELLRELKDTSLAELRFGGAELGALVALVDSGAASSAIAKRVFAIMMAEGGAPADIVAARGLQPLDGPAALAPLVDEVLARHGDEVARYRSGKTSLLGFFVGQVMKASHNRADAAQVRALLAARLD